MSDKVSEVILADWRTGEIAGQAVSGRAEEFLIPLMSRKDRAIYLCLAGFWACSLVIFWRWWLHQEHDLEPVRFLINSVFLFWTTVVPGYFLLIFSRSRISNPSWILPAGLRVAMIVTKTPAEPAAMVQKTLAAMLAQDYPHDTWLADEDPSIEMLIWCADHGVHVSTRKNVPEYHNEIWPRRTKSKEGNLAYFYDRVGYENYDIVVQLDSDHVPDAGYLEEMLRPFADPRVGYVSAPSICDSNADESWSARGRLNLEAALHGALQTGYNGGLAPLCIGSHYAVRTRALNEIGGLGPELAEDHSTTLIMNAHGWRGVHALEALAHGEGPYTFHDLVVQEFQWSRSLITILLRYTPAYLGRLPMSLKAQFLFSQLWYPLFSLAMLATVGMPIIALLTRSAWVNIVYVEFLIRMTLVSGSIVLVMHWVRKKGWCRPTAAKVVSWEGIVFLFARWPWAFFGVLAAVADWLMGRESGFRVTPKGRNATSPLPMIVILPYVVISVASALPVLFMDEVGNASGFYVFSVFNSFLYLLIAGLILVLHPGERGQRAGVATLPSRKPVLVRLAAFGLAGAISISAATLRLPTGLGAFFWGMPPLSGDLLTASLSTRSKIALGVYDPKGAFAESDGVAIDHVFVSWLDDDHASITKAFEDARLRNRWIMITVEPWPHRAEGRDAHLLDDIVAGGYDLEIDRICREVAGLGAPLFLRWGHEMEVATGRYPWAQPDGDRFVRAYRYVIDRCRQWTGRIFYVWSPRGEDGLNKYYPGPSYADYVGVSIYSFSDWDLAKFGDVRSFAKNFGEKYDRIRKYDKPVMIAELGVKGSPLQQRTWLARAFANFDEFPLLRSVVYFDAHDSPEAWDSRFGVPDWTIDPRYLTHPR